MNREESINIKSELDFKFAVTFDADGQHDSNIIKKYFDTLSSGYDLVIGVRNKTNRFSENIFGFYSNIKFGIKDPLCGLKGYNLEIYKELGFFDSYNSIGTEMMLYAAKNKKKISQIKFNVSKRIDKPRIGNIIKANFIILKSLTKAIFKY